MDELNELPLWGDNDAYGVLEKLCATHRVPIDVLKELVKIERQHQHRERAKGIYEEFDSAFEQMD
jgi:hypothetical protein